MMPDSDVAAPVTAPINLQVTHSTDELIRSAVGLARTCLGMDVGFVTEFRSGMRIFRHVASAEDISPIRVGDCDPLDQSYCQLVVSGAIPAMVQDSRNYPALLALGVTAQLGIRTHIGVPIRFSDGALFGTFCCYSRSPDVMVSGYDVATLTRFAALIGELIEGRVLGERARAAVVERLLDVIAANRFEIVFQPVIDIDRRSVVGYEALARFDSQAAQPERSPDQWFNEAHGVELGHRLELRAIEKALQSLDRIPAGAYLALNVSPQTILTGALEAALADVPLTRLMLEITEHSSIVDYTVMAQSLLRLREAGLRLAVDDAGSGYASFRHILKLKPDVIKLDQSLIRDIDHEAGARALTTALISFAASTGSTVVAEGVESEEELAVLRALGISTVQGYLLGRPDSLPAHLPGSSAC